MELATRMPLIRYPGVGPRPLRGPFYSLAGYKIESAVSRCELAGGGFTVPVFGAHAAQPLFVHSSPR